VPDPVWADTINQMIYTVAAVLVATGRVGAWDLDWPNNSLSDSSPFDDRIDYITAVVEIVNEHGVSIGSQTITVPAGFNVQQGVSRSVVPRQWEGNVVLESVDANLVTDNLGVQVAYVNDVPAADAARWTGVTVMSNVELYSTFGIHSAPTETPDLMARGDGTTMFSDPARFWSVGFAGGISPVGVAGAPVPGFTFQATLAPLRHSFIRIGSDFIFRSFTDYSAYSGSFNPFVHYALFLPFAGGWNGGWYIGTGFCLMNSFLQNGDSESFLAIDFTTGFMLRWVSISYILRTDFYGFSDKLAIGFNIRFRSRETR